MRKKVLNGLLLLTSLLSADQYSFLVYNDSFAGTDKHFTNGINLSWLDDTFNTTDNNQSSIYSNLLHDLVNKIPLIQIDHSKNHNAGISLSQIMITPSDIEISTPQYDDVPYAGYLALAFYMFEWDKESFREFRVEFGVVGKESGAEFAQKLVHRTIGSPKPQGWDTQIGTQYTVNMLFRYGEKTWVNNNINGLSMDWFNHFGIQAGNFITDAFGGTMLRIGDNYIKNFNVHYPYLKEEASLLQSATKHSGVGWSLSTGLNAELLGYTYILNEAKSEGYSTQKNLLNISLYAGADLYYAAHKLTLFYESQSPYTTQQNKADIFGGLIYSYQF